jgi:hypothetical protein
MGEANLKVDLSVKVKLNAMLSTNATPLEAHTRTHAHTHRGHTQTHHHAASHHMREHQLMQRYNNTGRMEAGVPEPPPTLLPACAPTTVRCLLTSNTAHLLPVANKREGV